MMIVLASTGEWAIRVWAIEVLLFFFVFSLSISGKKVWAIIPPVEARSRNSGTPSTQSSEYSHLEEEIFEKEGEYEEIIAVDYKDM